MNYYLQQFLESSTIHGLVYISSQKRLQRWFWILVVITGFTIAGLLINQSFENWTESPIKTTIETKPISGITFPSVTVCPPKDTFTDLNYDLRALENVSSLPEETMEELINNTMYFLHDQQYDQLMKNISKIEEVNRYFNLYHGYTRLTFPYINRNGQLYYEHHTSATSGVLKTQFFGEKYDSQKVERSFLYFLYIYKPRKVFENQLYIVCLKIKRVAIIEYGFDGLWVNGDITYPDEQLGKH